MNIMLTFVVLTTVGRTSLWDISNYFWDCISSLAGSRVEVGAIR